MASHMGITVAMAQSVGGMDTWTKADSALQRTSWPLHMTMVMGSRRQAQGPW
jgi:hypothetical protein